EGRFVGSQAIEVGGRSLRFRRAVVATGARPEIPPIVGLPQAGYLTNETVFSLREQPPRLAVIGAGPVGCELAQAFRRLGSEVVLFDVLPRILGGEDADAAALLTRVLERDGVRLALGVEIRHVERSNDGRTIQFTIGGKQDAVTVDEILVGAGRAPNV